MTTKEIVRALRELEADNQCSCICDECDEDDCLTPLFRSAADLIEQMVAENADLRKGLERKDMVIALAQRKQAEAEAERDVLIEQIKARRSCLDCKHFDYCEFDDATVIDCMNCVTKNCPCYQCGNSSRWEWRGLPEAPEEGEKA